MIYAKPELSELGSACELIEECGKKGCPSDVSEVSDDPAYDLDE